MTMKVSTKTPTLIYLYTYFVACFLPDLTNCCHMKELDTES